MTLKRKREPVEPTKLRKTAQRRVKHKTIRLLYRLIKILQEWEAKAVP
jgi:hypothetical protein